MTTLSIFFVIVLIVTTCFSIALVYTIWHIYHTSEDVTPPPQPATPLNAIIILIYVATFVIGTLAAAFGIGHIVHEANPQTDTGLTVHVGGQQWWWEVSYPEQDIKTANEITIPTGEQVLVHLTSENVTHSFWIPELDVRETMVPGYRQVTALYAEEPGVFDGQCGEFCGIQHAKMNFRVIALAPAEFDAWLDQQQHPAVEPQTEAAQDGQRVFMEVGCAECHRIHGTSATGIAGPDLTHVASRQTLGAGIMSNNRGNLAGWIANPHAMKPGNRMPPSDLSAGELQSLLAYLSILE